MATFRRILEVPFRFFGRLELEDLFTDFNNFCLLLDISDNFSEDFIDGNVTLELFLLSEGVIFIAS